LGNIEFIEKKSETYGKDLSGKRCIKKTDTKG
jgi:hypothetical protein